MDKILNKTMLEYFYKKLQNVFLRRDELTTFILSKDGIEEVLANTDVDISKFATDIAGIKEDAANMRSSFTSNLDTVALSLDTVNKTITSLTQDIDILNNKYSAAQSKINGIEGSITDSAVYYDYADNIYKAALSEINAAKGEFKLQVQLVSDNIDEKVEASITGSIDELGSKIKISADNITFNGTTEFEKGILATDGIFTGTLSGVEGDFTGDVTANSLTINGDVTVGDLITIGKDPKDITQAVDNQTGLSISKEGLLKANNAVISGKIYATGGEFTGDVKANSLTLGDTCNIGGKFIVNPDGTFEAKDATITGAINATSLTLGDSGSYSDWNVIKGEAVNFDATDAANAIEAKINETYVQIDSSSSNNGTLTFNVNNKLYTAYGTGIALATDVIVGTAGIDATVIKPTSLQHQFSVSKEGLLTALNAVIYGTVYATNGVFNGTVYATDGEFNGTIHATDGEFVGTITANDGTIGGETGWVIQSGEIVSADGVATLSGNAGEGIIFSADGAGTIGLNLGEGLFCKNANDKYVFVIDATTGGGLLAYNKINWDSDGNLDVTGTIHATDGEFTGKITSTEGEIGGWKIDENQIYCRNTDDDDQGIFIDSKPEEGISIYGEGCHLDINTAGINVEGPDGTPIVNVDFSEGNATFKGEILTTSGNIGGWEINDEGIESVDTSDGVKGTSLSNGAIVVRNLNSLDSDALADADKVEGYRAVLDSNGIRLEDESGTWPSNMTSSGNKPWSLNTNGSGQLANGHIQWTKDGEITFTNGSDCDVQFFSSEGEFGGFKFVNPKNNNIKSKLSSEQLVITQGNDDDGYTCGITALGVGIGTTTLFEEGVSFRDSHDNINYMTWLDIYNLIHKTA